jgi:hypothetical protein
MNTYIGGWMLGFVPFIKPTRIAGNVRSLSAYRIAGFAGKDNCVCGTAFIIDSRPALPKANLQNAIKLFASHSRASGSFQDGKVAIRMDASKQHQRSSGNPEETR